MSLPISGFTAVPNPMMLSFLATQGFAIMYYGGAGWQFGKRKVSGMSNEQVNAMSPNDFLMKLHAETKTMVPTMAKGMEDMTPLVSTTLELFGQYIREAIKAFPQVVSNILGTPTEFSNVPTTGQTSGNLPPQMASFLHYFKTLSDATNANVSTVDIVNQETLAKDIQMGFDPSKGKIHLYKGKYYTLQILQNLLKAKDRGSIIQTAKTTDVTKFQSITEKAAIKKRKAGQSQIMERKKLIADIKRWETGLLKQEATNRRKTTVGRRQNIQKIKRLLLRDKRALALLLQRYRF